MMMMMMFNVRKLEWCGTSCVDMFDITQIILQRLLPWQFSGTNFPVSFVTDLSPTFHGLVFVHYNDAVFSKKKFTFLLNASPRLLLHKATLSCDAPLKSKQLVAIKNTCCQPSSEKTKIWPGWSYRKSVTSPWQVVSCRVTVI